MTLIPAAEMVFTTINGQQIGSIDLVPMPVNVVAHVLSPTWQTCCVGHYGDPDAMLLVLI